MYMLNQQPNIFHPLFTCVMRAPSLRGQSTVPYEALTPATSERSFVLRHSTTKYIKRHTHPHKKLPCASWTTLRGRRHHFLPSSFQVCTPSVSPADSVTNNACSATTRHSPNLVRMCWAVLLCGQGLAPSVLPRKLSHRPAPARHHHNFASTHR